jgi:hypothetical protein
LRLAADDLDEDALVDEIAALLDGRAFRGRPDVDGRGKRRLGLLDCGLEQVAW